MTDTNANIARWREKVALVTGASSGIGREVAAALSKEGINVVLAARRRAELETLEHELVKDPSEILVAPTDLRSESSIKNLFGTIRGRFGGVDILINNAGLGHKAPLLSGKTEHWREMLEVNVLALCICAREAVSDMIQGGGEGHVINISSMAAHRVPQGSGVYSATKFAVRALTEGLRQELYASRAPVRVTSVSPGFVETGFAAHYHKNVDAAKETYSLYKVLEARDIADAVLFALAAPPHMQVHDILIRPKDQPT